VARFFDAANLLSLSRVPLAALVWVRPHDGAWLVAMLGLAGASDVLDGYYGRRLHGPRRGTADVGAWLDPVCDKVFMASTVAAVVVAWEPPALVIALVLLRDVLLAALVPVFRLAGGRDRFHAHDFRARVSGKATTVAQFATVLAIVFVPSWALALAWISACVGLLAVVERIVLAMRNRRDGQARAA
jgi:phosphatidylglycerophosphate synthase